MASPDSFRCRRELEVDARRYAYYDLRAAEANGLAGAGRLPASLRTLLENLLRCEDGRTVTKADIEAVAAWAKDRGKTEHEIAFRPARVLMQDFTGVPAVVDLAAMRDATKAMGGDPRAVNPLVPVDLVIDHSVMVDYFASPDAFARNVAREYERNGERYTFLKWGQQAFANFRVVPPGTGICHQVNLEYLAQTVWTKEEADGSATAFPDTCVGTDSHTTMINGLAVLGWGVGGIEAEAAMLGQPVSMLIPEVIGFELTGRLAEGATATDLVLTVTQLLRKKGVVGKFVEFFGPGLAGLTLEDRATIANMAPEYGATCGFFPIDQKTIAYLAATGRDPHRVRLVEAYAKANGLWAPDWREPPLFTDVLSLDLGAVEPSLAGPKRPQDRVGLKDAALGFATALAKEFGVDDSARAAKRVKVEGQDWTLGHGDVVIAAITSCTNTSNPSVMLAAGLLARNARRRGLKVKPFVKTSLAPGSQVVTDYLARAGLAEDLEALGFNLVGYGCTTCIGNSGPLPDKIAAAVKAGDLVVCSVLSGNRNFEGRVNPDTRANYLASPPLVVAYALAGSLNIDLVEDPVGHDENSDPVFLSEIWPSSEDVAAAMRHAIAPELFAQRYADVFKGDERWRAIEVTGGLTYEWSEDSTYVRNPPYFTGAKADPTDDILAARILGVFGDSITTDHISPAGSIKAASPAGAYLISHGVEAFDFNSYGARRGNHEVMMRGTFANIRIKNRMLGGVEGGLTRHIPSGEQLPIYDAAMRYLAEGTPLVIFAGKEYGAGSSRDWAAKGTRLLGVRAVIAESFERIHRSNLVGMGVLPLQFADGAAAASLGLKGDETVSITGLKALAPRAKLEAVIAYPDGKTAHAPVIARIDTENELDYFRTGGILPYVLKSLVKQAA